MTQPTRTGVFGTARRRRSRPQTGEHPLITLPRSRDSYVPFDAHAFRNAMNVLVARAREPFTVVVIKPALPDATSGLAEVIVSQLRAGSGDLAGHLESAIAVVLQAAGRDGGLRFLGRLRDIWPKFGGGELCVEIAEHPEEEQRVIELLTSDWSAETSVALADRDAARPE